MMTDWKTRLRELAALARMGTRVPPPARKPKARRKKGEERIPRQYRAELSNKMFGRPMTGNRKPKVPRTPPKAKTGG